MGISCQINIYTPFDGVFHSGQKVSGVINFFVDKPMLVDKIVTSLKGIGYIALTVSRGSSLERTYTTKEVYIDLDTVIQSDKVQISNGLHEIKFRYFLPQNVPSTMKLGKAFKWKSYKVKCFIIYYVRIKFERPGVFAFNKHFRKEINVISTIAPTLPREPAVFTETAKCLSLFSRQDNLITINATIINSVLPITGKIELRYDVQNNSHIVIKSTKTQLVQQYIFKSKGHRKVMYAEVVSDTKAKTVPVKSQETQNRSISINIPTDLYNIGNSAIVARFYLVRIVAQLPIPFKNVVLDVPVQIGIFHENLDVNRAEGKNGDINYDDPPASYREAMAESHEEYVDDNDDETDTTKLLNRPLSSSSS